MRRLKIALLGALVAVGTFPVSAAQASDEDVLEYRQRIMHAMDEQSAMLGQIVSMSIPDDNVIEHLETLALLASTALKSFEPEVQGGEARPEVWSEWEDFSQRMNEFADKTARAAESARKNGKQDALAGILDVLSCKSCHDVYRAEPQ